MAAGHGIDPVRWWAVFDQFMARIAGRLGRIEPRATARAYLLGLVSGVERKDCWRLAERAGCARPGPMQHLPRYSRWDADAVRDEVRDDVRTYAVEHLGADGGVLIVDETGSVKKDRASTTRTRLLIPALQPAAAALGPPRGQDRLDQLPLGVGQIAGVTATFGHEHGLEADLGAGDRSAILKKRRKHPPA